MFPLFIFVAEFFIFWKFVGMYGFFDVLGSYLLPTLLGLTILSFQTRTAFAGLQSRLAKGQDPGREIIGTAATFFAGVLLLVPSITTRVFGIALLVPGLRQLMILFIHGWIIKKMAQGSFRVMRGPGFGAGFGGSFGSGGPFGTPPNFERDATPAARDVIDVTPIEIIHEDKKTDRN